MHFLELEMTAREIGVVHIFRVSESVYVVCVSPQDSYLDSVKLLINFGWSPDF